MNWPNPAPQPAWAPQPQQPQPGGYPPQAPQPAWGAQPPAPRPQQQQAWGAQPPPMQPPPVHQPYPVQAAPVQPYQNFAPPPLAQAGATNLMDQYMQEPPQQRVQRTKPADGTFVVQFTTGCKMEQSKNQNKNFGMWFLLIEYRVVDGTVPQMLGQTFAQPYFWNSAFQMKDLADLAKYAFGHPDKARVLATTAQAQGNPQILAQMIATTLAQGLFGGVKIYRSQKKVAEVGYENAFANLQWLGIGPMQPTLAQLNAPRPQTQVPMPGAPQVINAPQPAPQYQQPAPQYQQAPPPGAWGAPQSSQTAPPTPAFWVPPGGPPR